MPPSPQSAVGNRLPVSAYRIPLFITHDLACVNHPAAGMVLNHWGWGAISGSEAASLLGLSERLAPGSPRPPIPGDWHSRTHAANGQNRWVTKTDRITDQRHHRAAGGGMPRARIELATPQFSVV